MKRIGVFTATRAEYGLLNPVIKELRKYEDNTLKVELIVTGTHLCEKYGMTVKEIEADGNRIDHKIKIPVESGSPFDIINNQAETLKSAGRLFEQVKYDAVVILGDRYEMLMVAAGAVGFSIPIFHIGGGDTTEGAIDECIRHSITKMSYLHFTINEKNRSRVIQLGENPDRVFNYGSPGVDNALNLVKLSKRESLNRINLNDCKYGLCTYHPETLSVESLDWQLGEFKKAISEFDDIEFIITKSNADLGGEFINSYLDDMDREMENVHVFSSLGTLLYLSLMQNAEFVLGNSSSGILEAPSFHIPTINIGDRQRGRLQAESIINCENNSDSIKGAIYRALSEEAKNTAQKATNPYGNGNASENIAKKCVECIRKEHIDLKKIFYDFERRT